MKTLFLVLAISVAFSLHAQISRTKSAGFDHARLEVLHDTTKRFVDEGKHAGIITLLTHNGKVVDFQT